MKLYLSRFGCVSKTHFWKELREQCETPENTADICVIVPSKPLKDTIAAALSYLPSLPQITTLDDYILGESPKLTTPTRYIIQHHCGLENPSPGFVEQLMSLEEEIRKYQISIDALEKELIHPYPIKKQILSALKTLRENQNIYNIADSIHQYPLGIQTLNNHPSEYNKKQLFILGFWDIPPYQREAISALNKLSASLSLLVHYDADTPSTSPAEKLVHWALSKKETALVKEPTPPVQEQKTTLSIFETQSLKHDIRTTVSTLLSLHHTQQIPLSDIGIVLPSPRYKEPLVDALTAAGIPLPENQERTVAETPIGQLLSLWLHTLLNPTKKAMKNLIRHPIFKAVSFPNNTFQEKDLSGDPELNSLPLISQLEKAKNITTLTAYIDLITTLLNHLDHYLPEGLKESITATLSALTPLPFNKMHSTQFLIDALPQLSITTTAPSTQVIYSKMASYCIEKKVWILPGFTSQFWPKTPPPSALLSNQGRKNLQLTTQQEFRNWDTFLFLSLCHHTRSQLIFTCPMSIEGSPCLDSQLLQKLQDNWGIPLTKVSPPANQDKTAPVENTMPLPLTQTHILLPPSQFETISITALEGYQKCPHRFFYESILKASAPQSEEEPGPAEWGTLIHNILDSYNNQCKKDTIIPMSANAELRHQLLTKIAKEKCLPYINSSAFWDLKINDLFEDTDQPGFLKRYIQFEHENPMPLSPIRFEEPLSFTLKHDTGTITIKGKIDALYETRNTGKWVVLDYKTGKTTPSPKDIETHTHIQCGTYLLGLKETHPEKKPGAAIIVKLNHTVPIEKVIILVEESIKKDLLENSRKRPPIADEAYFHTLKHHLSKVISLLLSGYISPNPHPDLPQKKQERLIQCQYCDWKPACHYADRYKQVTS